MKTYRPHNPLEHGADLLPLQKALKADHFYGGPVDGIFGAGTQHACLTAKYHLGYPKKAILPIGGQLLLDFLDGNKGLPLAYRMRRRARGFGISKEELQRAELVKWAMWGAANEPRIHYTESSARDDWLWRPAGHLDLWTDCSGFVTACYKWAGLSDPNGLGYRAVGYTGTLLNHGVNIPLYQAMPGDLVIWGWAPGHHTAIFVESGHVSLDPFIVSHGGERGPNHEHFSSENAVQRRPFVIKRYI